ncbi:MAG: OmpA family protein [Gemmatimonadota bacterium]
MSGRPVLKAAVMALVLAFLAGPGVDRAIAQTPTATTGGSQGRTDLLSWGTGAFAVRLEAPGTNETIRNAIDGSTRTLGIGIPRREPLPHRFVIELPALTTFDTFAIPVINEFGPARGRHVRTIEIEGSVEGPEGGFTPLATLTVQLDQTEPQQFPVSEPRPVRWLRVRLVDRLLPPPADFDETVFSELIGYGTQEPIADADDKFTGRWRLRRTGINDVPGTNVIELIQEGSSIRGCEIAGGRQAEVTGSIVNGLAQLLFAPEGGRLTPVLASVTEAGELVGARFTAGFSDFWASPDPGAALQCMEAPEATDPIAEALEAGEVAIIHGINFDVDSDVLRPDATPALERVLAALQATGTLAVTIAGHTDWDGTDEHNLDLSQRRAEAVIAWLVERGVADAWLVERGVADARLRPVGRGEGQPIADNESSAGRALNRRVEVSPN